MKIDLQKFKFLEKMRKPTTGVKDEMLNGKKRRFSFEDGNGCLVHLKCAMGSKGHVLL